LQRPQKNRLSPEPLNSALAGDKYER